MHVFMIMYVTLLFYLLTPGVLVTLPSNSDSKYSVAIVHTLVFALIYYLTYALILDALYIDYGMNKK